MKGRVYLDTSAYLAVLLGAPEARTVTPELASKGLCSSALLLIEAERNLVRLAREKKLSLKDYETTLKRLSEDRKLFLLRDVTPDLCLTGQYPAVSTPRSSDLVHLRTALWFIENGELDKFITLDRDQLKAARELGLPVGD